MNDKRQPVINDYSFSGIVKWYYALSGMYAFLCKTGAYMVSFQVMYAILCVDFWLTCPNDWNPFSSDFVPL